MSRTAIRQQWLSRRKRLKRVLRMLPRRANVGTYPVIRRFADAARSRPYLWSFKREHLWPALYVGSVLAFMPTYGLQIFVALLAAMVVRANLTVMVALQMIANPLTLAPLYLMTHTVGQWLIEHIGYGAVDAGVASSVNALVLGGIVVGFATAVLLDLVWRLLAWESRRFAQRYQSWHAAHTILPDAHD
jgi:uncharacterized protein (DUF2062 family)